MANGDLGVRASSASPPPQEMYYGESLNRDVKSGVGRGDLDAESGVGFGIWRCVAQIVQQNDMIIKGKH